MKRTVDESGYKPGDPAFLGCLQNTTTHLWNGLSTVEQERYAAIAKQWSEDAPPKAVQSK